ncbi:MAG: Unknown protein [uncultured Campylobacterales bacterium]|uniref:Uncharacterized protein n=1 Tax=uncultured Campylobacterales bacterium TaxID=352960 RepID=A0A6S6SY28_9BACT|nr:MAG: Unknown protein [uncultured Campylobacterales bacterium]
MLFEMFNEKTQKENKKEDLDWIKKRKQSNLSRYKSQESKKNKKFEINRDLELYGEELMMRPLFFF